MPGECENISLLAEQNFKKSSDSNQDYLPKKILNKTFRIEQFDIKKKYPGCRVLERIFNQRKH